MSDGILFNRVRRGAYLDSVALMRMSREIADSPGVMDAALMSGTPANREILRQASLLDSDGDSAGANDIVVAVRAADGSAAAEAAEHAGTLLDQGREAVAEGRTWRPHTLAAALDSLAEANLALISVPGEYAAPEARRALQRDLHVMLFSDNVPIADEVALKRLARDRGLLLMGPDCGTAYIGGAAIAFANLVPRGDIGIVAASGTGMQEVTCQIANGRGGISQGIGVGGRDLSEAVGGLMTLSAIDALDADPDTRHVVLLSKPPDPVVAARVLERVATSPKTFTVCFLGAKPMALPANAAQASTLRAAARHALGAGDLDPQPLDDVAQAAVRAAKGRGWSIRGLFAGGTLCAESQVILTRDGESVRSNAPVGGVHPLGQDDEPGHRLIDLGDDEFTRGRPHPMLEPGVRIAPLTAALEDPAVGVILLDIILGYGAHSDPTTPVAEALVRAGPSRPAVVASVCGTEADPQRYGQQVRRLEAAGALVMVSNARATELALAVSRGLAKDS